MREFARRAPRLLHSEELVSFEFFMVYNKFFFVHGVLSEFNLNFLCRIEIKLCSCFRQIFGQPRKKRGCATGYYGALAHFRISGRIFERFRGNFAQFQALEINSWQRWKIFKRRGNPPEEARER